MKHITLSLALLALPLLATAQSLPEKSVKSDIEEVKVFLQGAQITRKGTTTTRSGKQVIKLTNLSPHIDKNSIQVKANGNFTVLGVKHDINYLEELDKNKKIDSLTAEIEAVEDKLTLKRSRLEVLAEKKSLLSANKNLGGTNNGTSLTQLKQAIDFYDRELTAIEADELKTQKNIDDLNEQLGKLKRELQSAQRIQEFPSGEIHVRIDAPKSTPASFEVRYLVSNAGWYPKYDVRATKVNQPIQLAYKAEVYQNTGINWNNVNLRLSNGNPNQSGTMPELGTWYLNYYQPNRRFGYDDAQLDEVIVTEALEGQVASVRMKKEAAPAPVASRVQANAVENQTTVDFVIDRPYSVNSNGEAITVDLKEHTIPATYQYYATPKLDTDAFLVARITNWDQYNLLEGEANLYFEDAYVGRSILDAKSLSDTLNISLGRDKSIVIGREKVDQFSKRRTIGSNKVDSRAFEITVRNKKSQPVDLILYDQIPVSTRNEIEIEAEELSGGKLDESTGKVTWQLKLPAGEQTKLTLSYEVKYPKREKVILE
ncbi:DUF4139 domain-containing protein [Gangjinia marincola]|uniref:DUF4139 domain-containing protein n=1 Tax=Gangjinia marincola TaxID=578463 RepID=A0ABN1MFH2_9FLAO